MHLHGQDLAEAHGAVWLPHALEKKFRNANREWGWQRASPARQLFTGLLRRVVRRQHMDPGVVNNEMKVAARRVGMAKLITAHTCRHSLAMHRLRREADMRTIRRCWGTGRWRTR